MSDNPGTSTRPYLLRALHDWCTDNGFTPYIAVAVGPGVQVPAEYVKNNEIVLNIGFEATSGLQLGNEAIEFKARFGGMPREIRVPVGHVVAIYARENGQGMAFPQPAAEGARPDAAPGPGAPRGLRLAGTGPAHEPGAQVVRTAPATPAGETPTDPPDPDTSLSPGPPEPPDPGAPGGARPSLKRIK